MCTHYETKIKTKNKKNNTLQKVLLAPTSTMDPSVPVEEVAEPVIKHAGMQTMYRESEAQTMPYTPAHVVPDGTTPEVLLLKDLKYSFFSSVESFLPVFLVVVLFLNRSLLRFFVPLYSVARGC